MSVVSVLSACAAAPPPAQTTTPASGMRHRPRHTAVNRVLDAASQRAGGCLPPASHPVTVQGAFDGATGEYRVVNITSDEMLGTSIRACVRSEFESARIDPFLNNRFDASRTFGPEGVIAADAGVVATSGTTAQPVAANGDASATAMAAPPDAATESNDAGATASTPSTGSTNTTATESPSSADAGAVATNTTSAQSTTEPTTVAPAHPTTAPPPRTTPQRTPPVALSDAGPVSRAALVGCYRGVVRTEPSLSGRVRLQFTVTTDGVPQNVHSQLVGASVGRPAMLNTVMRCFEQRVRQQTFSPHVSGEEDLMITLFPRRNGGDLSIENARLGMLSAAPGTGAVASTTAGPPNTDSGLIAVSGATNPPPQATPTSPAAASADELRDFSNTLRGHVDTVRNCYQQQLGRDPQLQLRVRVRFVVQPDGSVSAVSSTTTVAAGDADAATDVARCLEGLVHSLAFAHPSQGPVEASVPFAFAPSGAAPAPAAPSTFGPTNSVLTGRIDPALTSQSIRNHTATIRECYTRALATDSTLAGRIVVRFTVDSSGRVLNPMSAVTVRSGTNEHMQSVARCVQDVLESIALPPPSGGPAAVALPFDFGPST